MNQPSQPLPGRRAVLLSASLSAVAWALAGCGSASTVAASGATGVTTGRTQATAVGAGLFTAGQSHIVRVEWEDEAFQQMIAAYQADGSKDWMSADVTIDGTLLSKIGIRLKGNSTLKSLSSDGGGAGQAAGGAEIGRTRVNGKGPGGGGVGGAAFAESLNISADDPASLPLLFSLDKYVDGQSYQGLTQLALRPGTPVVNEALALALMASTGQPTQRYTYASYSVNGSRTQTRLLVENPDETYADALFPTSGVLYKADADSSLSYQGDEQATYSDQFKQLNLKDSQDLQPLIDFLKWFDSASDDTFATELAQWIDIESFARYSATQMLLVNGDDISGPGHNYYLRYDLGTKKMTVISWDLNLALRSNPTATTDQVMAMGKAGGNQSEDLKQRFLASEAFSEQYTAALVYLYGQMYRDGTALQLLDDITGTIPTSEGLSSADLQAQVSTLRTFIEKRTEALKDLGATS